MVLIRISQESSGVSIEMVGSSSTSSSWVFILPADISWWKIGLVMGSSQRAVSAGVEVKLACERLKSPA
jgi:hypothetical protein